MHNFEMPMYLTRQLGARINELFNASDCIWLRVDCSISRYVKTQIFTHPDLIAKLEEYGITHIPKGKTDQHSVVFEKKGLGYKSEVTFQSGRIVHALCPHARRHYDYIFSNYDWSNDRVPE